MACPLAMSGAIIFRLEAIGARAQLTAHEWHVGAWQAGLRGR